MDKDAEISTLNDFPMPPSTNQMYRIFRGRPVKSPKYAAYENEVRIWMMKNREELDAARAMTLLCGPGKFLHMDVVFRFERKSILSKENKPIRLDLDNKLKVLWDVIAKILGIGDEYFWSLYADKDLVGPDESAHAEVTLMITDFEPSSPMTRK